MLSARDIESIERATLAAVAPREVEEFEAWLLAFDDGAIGRAKSAAPLSHAAAAPGAELRSLGYSAVQPTLVMLAPSATVHAISSDLAAKLDTVPDEGWRSVFGGPGFDPADGASRARSLARARDAIYASVVENGRTVAIGTASFAFNWASVHGMRTLDQARSRGFASRILATLAGAALERGYARLFLQVEEGNRAVRLYERAGFTRAWRYRYWRA